MLFRSRDLMVNQSMSKKEENEKKKGRRPKRLIRITRTKWVSTISIYYFFVVAALYITLAHAATFNIRNNCPYTVWAAAAPGGGRQLDHGQVWDLNVSSGTGSARIWARTNCEFDEAGQGKANARQVTVGAPPMPRLWCTPKHPG